MSLASHSFPKRMTVFIYGVISYLLGVSALLGIIAVSIGLVTFQEEPFIIMHSGAALLFNLFLMFLFGLQHSVMARPWFKKKWTKVIPAEAERSTYVLATAIVTWIMLVFWQANAAAVWSVEDSTFSLVLTVVGVLGGYIYF